MQKIEKFILVIFGATGDLAKRKLFPALLHLYNLKQLPENFKIVGTGRTELNGTAFRELINEALNNFLPDKSSLISAFTQHITYHPTNPKELNSYQGLVKKLECATTEVECRANYLFYYAIPPQTYGTVTENLYKCGLLKEENYWRRVIIEKPFGKNYKSAHELNLTLSKYLKEEQIYRIDHYLGKETVQNIFVTRFSNTIFEPLWNRNYINYVEITSSEQLSVGSRAAYYNKAGALRDMVQNHLLQLLALVAMEPPINAEADTIRDEMVKVFKSLRKIEPNEVGENVVRAQYTTSTIKNREIKGYLQEENIPQDSTTETYVAMRCFVDNWRWSGVPFYIRTGKCLPARVTEVVIHFKSTHHKLFEYNTTHKGNQLVIRIQPDEGVQLKIGMKQPGSGFVVNPSNLDFKYNSLENNRLPDAYERLICDCIQGDATLYQREDAVNATWHFVEPIIEAWCNNSVPLHNYKAGTWGPEAADELLRKDENSWREPCKNLVGSDLVCEL